MRLLDPLVTLGKLQVALKLTHQLVVGLLANQVLQHRVDRLVLQDTFDVVFGQVLKDENDTTIGKRCALDGFVLLGVLGCDGYVIV